MSETSGKFSTAESRWAGVGPYYAMFPTAFADSVIERYTSPGETVLDPFAGRGTAIFSAGSKGRCGVGVELNPVGWVYAQAKLRPAPKDDVLERLREIGRMADRRTSKPNLPLFYSWCFSKRVRHFLLTARKYLNWRQCQVDFTLAALLLVNLHGKREASLSNQMRQTKSMSPDYAVAWWRERGVRPPEVDPVAFMEKRIEWRYVHGIPKKTDSFVYLGDCTRRLEDVRERVSRLSLPQPRLLFTSPPYCGITNYHYDQWLRLWVLGGPPNALAVAGAYRGKFCHRLRYQKLLRDVFTDAKKLLNREAVVYVRTDHRQITLDITIQVLREVFPTKRLRQYQRPAESPTQTHLFKNKIEKSAEVDLVLLPAA